MESDDRDAPETMTEKEAAAYIGQTYWQLRRWRVMNYRNRPPHRDIGKRIVYTRKSLDDWLNRQG